MAACLAKGSSAEHCLLRATKKTLIVLQQLQGNCRADYFSLSTEANEEGPGKEKAGASLLPTRSWETLHEENHSSCPLLSKGQWEWSWGSSSLNNPASVQMSQQDLKFTQGCFLSCHKFKNRDLQAIQLTQTESREGQVGVQFDCKEGKVWLFFCQGTPSSCVISTKCFKRALHESKFALLTKSNHPLSEWHQHGLT